MYKKWSTGEGLNWTHALEVTTSNKQVFFSFLLIIFFFKVRVISMDINGQAFAKNMGRTR